MIAFISWEIESIFDFFGLEMDVFEALDLYSLLAKQTITPLEVHIPLKVNGLSVLWTTTIPMFESQIQNISVILIRK